MVWEHAGPGEQGMKGESRRENSMKESGLEKKETFAAFFVGATGVSYRDFMGLLCIKFGKLHISGYPFSPSPFQISHP